MVQENPGVLKAVGEDIKAQHSLQKVSKGPDGHYVVGETRKPAAVAEFEFFYHEIRDIANLLAHLTAGNSEHMKCNLQCCFSKSRRLAFNTIFNISHLLDDILQGVRFLSRDRNLKP